MITVGLLAVLVAAGAIALLVVQRVPQGGIPAQHAAPAGGAAPAQATAAVVTLLSGDRAQVLDALSPALAATLPTDFPLGPREQVGVTLTDWRQQDVFAGATAVVHKSDGDTKLMIGFRQITNRWHITYAQAVPQ
jgi:hypothetical protein